MKFLPVSASLFLVALQPQRVAAVGTTIEDACVGLSENDPCTVKSPLQYAAYGFCQWTSTATEAPVETAPPNPANEVCLSLTNGDSCVFFDGQTGLPITGVCRQSTVVGFDLQCEADGQGETEEELDCDGIELHGACTILKPDGATITGTCESGGPGGLQCQHSDDTDPDTGSGDVPGSTDGLDINTLEPMEVACLKNTANVTYGWRELGDACSFEQNDNVTQNGTCTPKSGGEYFICESSEIGGDTNPNAGGAEVNPEITACDGLALEDACVIVDPVGDDDLNGTCSTSPQGDLFCQPGRRRRRLNLYLICAISDGGGEYTNAPKSTTKLGDLDNSNDPVTFENAAGAVVGGVIGGLLGVALIVVGAIVIYRRYGKRRMNAVDLDTEGGDVYQTL